MLSSILVTTLPVTLLADPLLATGPKREIASVPVPGPAGLRNVPLRSWKSFRDQSVEKQAHDFSCGASSIATILKYYYGITVSEDQVLQAIGKDKTRANFASMQEAVHKLGFRALGLATNYDQLSRLKMPVIVYVRYRRDDHFSVVQGIGPNTVLLADSSLGNRSFSRAQFLKMWETRTGDHDGESLKGRVLAILPAAATHRPSSQFFVSNPERQTAITVVTMAQSRGLF